jgi:hypothetical protein
MLPQLRILTGNDFHHGLLGREFDPPPLPVARAKALSKAQRRKRRERPVTLDRKGLTGLKRFTCGRQESG